jgi:tRNA(adenine34) deaminase
MNDDYFMKQALREAERALAEEEVPVGAVVVMNDKIIARGYNQVEKLNDCTAHAEIIALTSAFHYLGSKYLPEASVFITVEPCLMCVGALHWSKVGRVVYGADDEKNGFKKYVNPLTGVSPFHPKTILEKGIMKEECAELMKRFFQARRR